MHLTCLEKKSLKHRLLENGLYNFNPYPVGTEHVRAV